MLRSLRRILLIVGIVSATLLGASQTLAVAAPARSAPAAVPAAAPAGLDTTVSRGNATVSRENTLAALQLCFFYTRGDNVHRSGSDASGHGWWVNINCNATWAVVTVQLQEYYSDGSWRNKGTVGRATVRSGGGAGNRATGRAGCNNSNLTGWRSVIDVDLVGLADSPDKLTTSSQNIYCRRL